MANAVLHDTTFVYDQAAGLDEYNWAEFPIFDVSSTPSTAKKAITYSATFKSGITRSLKLECADGVPTVSDADVLFALLLIASQNARKDGLGDGRIGFQHRLIHFSKSQILHVLGWTDSGASYRRLCQALNRWKKTSFYFENWKDQKTGHYRPADCNIISSHSVLPSRKARGQYSLPFCHVNFTEEFWDLIQGENLFLFNFHVYRSLASGTSKQAYRLLSKRLIEAETCSFELRTFACGHLGFSPVNSPSRLRKRLQLVINELVRVGLIEECGDSERYTKIGHGQYEINFRKARQQPEGFIPPPEDHELVKQMLRYGVERKLAIKFYSDPKIPNERIDKQIQHLEHFLATEPQKVRGTAGWLRKAIEDDYPLPANFESREDREARARREKDARRKRQARLKAADQARQEREDQEAAARAAATLAEQERWRRTEAYLDTLPPAEREALIDQALEARRGRWETKYAWEYRRQPDEDSLGLPVFREAVSEYVLRKQVNGADPT